MSDGHRHGSGLGRGPRVCAGVLGVGGLGSGAVSVFTDANGVGSAALLAVGALFVFLSITGQALRRVRFGENEAEFYETAGREVVRTLTDPAAPAAAVETAADIIERSAGPERDALPDAVQRRLRGADYERSVLDTVRAEFATARMPDRTFDIVVEPSTAIEITYSSSDALLKNAPLWRERFASLAYLAAKAGIQRLVVVTNRPLNERITSQFADDPRVAFVVWAPVDGPERLVALLTEAMG